MSRLLSREARRLLKTFKLRRDEGESLVVDIAQDLWYRLNTPTSLGLSLCAKYGDLLSVLEHTVSAKDYTSAEDFRLDYQAVSFLKKCDFSTPTLKSRREDSALQKFMQAERQCSETNARFRSRYAGGASSPPVESVLFRAQRKIAAWIGASPDAREWAFRCRFGPGADDLTSGPCTGSYHKLSALSSTEDFADGALSLALDHPAWARSLVSESSGEISPFGFFEGLEIEAGELAVRICPGNKVAFVPKTALTLRSIAVEPRMNVYAQLGLGSILRDLLKTRAHLDLDEQRSNQELAYDASRFGHLATIDLSMASDTIARELVRDLLPEGWFNALNWCRSKNGFLNGSWFQYEKFSSMGNGFTFELESMIFFALVTSVCEHLGLVNYYTRVFGDDIICPTEAVGLLEEVLSYCGFTVNAQKSFSTGVFRESCGADFFDGTNVRPYFCKEVPIDAPGLFNLANGIRRAAYRSGHGFFCDRRFRPAWLRTVRRIPELLRSLYSVSLVTRRSWGFDIEAGDGGLALNQDEFLSTPFARFARELQAGWHFATAIARPWRTEPDDKGSNRLYAYALYSCRDGDFPVTPSAGLVSGRGSVGYQLTTRGYTPVVADYGPWL